MHVNGALRTSIDRSMWPISLSIKRAAEILSLLDIDADSSNIPVTFISRVKNRSRTVVDIMREILKEIGPYEFEELIKKVLESQDFENVRWTSGAGEHGADFVISVTVPFVGDLNIVIQVKNHYPEDNDTGSISQLRRAFEYYKAVAGLLVTSSIKLGQQLTESIEKLRTEGRTVAVLHGERLYWLILPVLAAEGSVEG